mmetsp:Transcript_6296/g.26434  ORF Transcript_6296/g.26434 Transcript_6296/m.26434 type:complete len:219 (+) Transcript_6296:165-821(+)
MSRGGSTHMSLERHFVVARGLLERVLVELRLGDVLLEVCFVVELASRHEAHPLPRRRVVSRDGSVVDREAVELVVVRADGEDVRERERGRLGRRRAGRGRRRCGCSGGVLGVLGGRGGRALGEVEGERLGRRAQRAGLGRRRDLGRPQLNHGHEAARTFFRRLAGLARVLGRRRRRRRRRRRAATGRRSSLRRRRRRCGVGSSRQVSDRGARTARRSR